MKNQFGGYVEYTIWILVIVLAGCLGFVVGVKSRFKDQKLKKAGTILIETSDPDGPFLFLNLDIPVDELGLESEVVCKVMSNSIASRD